MQVVVTMSLLEALVTIGGEKSLIGDHEPEREAAGLPVGGLTMSQALQATGISKLALYGGSFYSVVTHFIGDDSTNPTSQNPTNIIIANVCEVAHTCVNLLHFHSLTARQIWRWTYATFYSNHFTWFM